jgi:hypothetical protein
MKKTGAERLDKSSADAIHWAEYLSEQLVKVSDPTDVGWLVGWFSAYGTAVRGPLVKEVQELRQENKVLRESMTKVKIRSYELGQRKMHEMLLKSVQKVQESD